MGSQSRRKQPKRANKKHIQRRIGASETEEQVTTEKEISQATLKRLHTLGSQKFGSNPFSGHFDRWLMNVEAVLAEFESHPTIAIDEQYERERRQALDVVKLQLEERGRRECAIEGEIQNLSCYKDQLKQINAQYKNAAKTLKIQKNIQLKRLQSSIKQLKREQDKIIKVKHGLIQRLFRKDRDQEEAKVAQQLSDKQRELELAMLDFSAQKKLLREDYEAKREPVAEQIKGLRKLVLEAERDDSLEERWFACEALIDSVNGLLQRKTAQSQGNSNLPEI